MLYDKLVGCEAKIGLCLCNETERITMKKAKRLLNQIGASLLDLGVVVRHLFLKPQVSEPRRALLLDHIDSRRKSLHQLQYAHWHRCQHGDHQPPTLPSHSSLELMSGLQISVCLPCGMHQGHTYHSGQRGMMNLHDHISFLAYLLLDGRSTHQYILRGNHFY